MKILFIGSRLYDDLDWYVKSKGIESVLTESNEDAINLDLPDQVFIVPRGMDGPKQVALMQNVDAIVPLIGIDPPLIDVAHMKEEIEEEYDIPVIAMVLENRTLGMVYQWQSLLYDERHSQTLIGNSPDFVKLAESFGVNAERITKPGETKEALSKAIKDNEPVLLNVVIDSEEALPMLPPGAGINEMIGEYKLEKDVI